jgi:hypothetical protein
MLAQCPFRAGPRCATAAANRVRELGLRLGLHPTLIDDHIIWYILVCVTYPCVKDTQQHMIAHDNDPALSMLSMLSMLSELSDAVVLSYCRTVVLS